MLETMGQFGLQYREQAQGTLGSVPWAGRGDSIHQGPGIVRYR